MVHGTKEVRCLVIGLIPVLFLCTEMLNSPRVTPTIRLKKFLWEYLKAKCCTPPPVNLDEIRRRIIRDQPRQSKDQESGTGHDEESEIACASIGGHVDH